MVMDGPSAANVCLPETSPVIVSVPPVPLAKRGVRCPLDGQAGRYNATRPVIMYCSGKLIVARTLNTEEEGKEDQQIPILPDVGSGTIKKLSVLCYRGHSTNNANTTTCKLSKSGCYVASGDEKGGLKVWAFDHPDHLTKYDNNAILKGAVRDIDWDMESKRLVVVGERMDARSECAKAIQWDGVTAGQLSQFSKGRVASCAFKPSRPFRIVTSGMDEAKCYFHKGPPFQKVPSVDNVPAESTHGSRGGVQCIRYSNKGDLVVSVASDKAMCVYDGKTFELKLKLENIHKATVYSVAWNHDDTQLLTASGDGTCKLFNVVDDGNKVEEVHTWYPAKAQAGIAEDTNFDKNKVPVGGTQLGCTFIQGKHPVSVGLNGQISIMPMPGGAGGGSSENIRVVTGHYAPVSDLSVDKVNGLFYTGDTNGILCQHDLKTTQPIKRIHPSPRGDAKDANADLMYIVHGTTDRPAAISGVTVCPTNGTLISAGWDDKLYVTTKGANNYTANMSNPTPLGAQPVCLDCGDELVCVVTVKGLVLTDANANITSKSKTNNDGIIEIPYEAKCVTVSPNDKTVYVGGNNCNIYIYEVEKDGTGLKQINVIEGKHLKPVSALALSHDGNKLASGDERDVCVFDISSKADIKTLVGRGSWCFHLQRVSRLAWSLDDKIVASGGMDDSIYLWCLEKKMKRVHYPYAHRGGLTGLTFVNAGKMRYELLSVGTDSVVNRWDVTTDVKDKFGISFL